MNVGWREWARAQDPRRPGAHDRTVWSAQTRLDAPQRRRFGGTTVWDKRGNRRFRVARRGRPNAAEDLVEERRHGRAVRACCA